MQYNLLLQYHITDYFDGNQEALLYCVSDGALAEVSQRGCVVSFGDELQNLPGHGHGLLDQGVPIWAGELNQITSTGFFQP